MACQCPTVMTRNRKANLLFLAVFVHLLLLLSLNNVFFIMPIHDELEPIEPPTKSPPAKRLVLFLTDGLGLEDVFGPDSYEHLFLNRNCSSWGIVATASFPFKERAGHVAVLTGTYEHPLNSIWNEWFSKHFIMDSLITRSKFTWYWGRKYVANELGPKAYQRISPNNKHTVHLIEKFLTKNKPKIHLKMGIFGGIGLLFLVHLPMNMNRDVKDLDGDVEDISKAFEHTFKDNSTAFAVTSASGYDKHDSDGPFIAWGAGIKGNLSGVKLKRIDIAPLLACLIGVSIPVNSLGIVPLDFLNLTKEQVISEQATNALQISQIFKTFAKRIEADALHFQPYKKLNSAILAEKFTNLKYLYFKNRLVPLTEACHHLILDLLEGVSYYNNYYYNYITGCVILGYLLWLVYLIGPKDRLLASWPMILCILLVWVPVFYSSLPLTYYIYSAFPFIMLSFASLKLLGTHICTYKYHFIASQLVVIAIFSKYIVASLLVGAAFVVYTPSEPTPKQTKFRWTFLCLVLAMFAIIFPITNSMFLNNSLLLNGFCLWFYLSYKLKTNSIVFNIQKVSFILAGLHRFFPLKCFYINWFINIIPIVPISFTTNDDVIVKVSSIIFGLLPFYLMTSLSYEPIFLAFYVFGLIYWFIIETGVSEEPLLLNWNLIGPANGEKNKFNFNKMDFLSLTFLLTAFYGCTNNPISLNVLVPVFICMTILYYINVTTNKSYFETVCSLLLILSAALFQLLLIFVFIPNVSPQIGSSHFILLVYFITIVLFCYILVELLCKKLLFDFVYVKQWFDMLNL